MSQPEAKYRTELRSGPSVPDTLGGNQCSLQCLTLGRMFGVLNSTRKREDIFGAGEGRGVNLESGPCLNLS